MYLHGFLAGRGAVCDRRDEDGTAEIFIEGIDAGLAQHTAAAALAPGLGTLPFDAV